MKPIFPLFILLQVLSFFANAQSKLIATSNYHHDSTGFFLHDSTTNFYKGTNSTSAVQEYSDGFVTWAADSTLYYNKNAGNFNLYAKDVNTYNANYSLRIQYLGNLYNNLGVNTHTYQFDYYYNGIQLDSSIGIYTDVIANNTYKYYNTFYHYNGLNQMDTTWIIYFNNVGVYTSSIKQVNTYSGNNITEVLEYHSQDSLTYNPDSKTNYYYNANNTTDSVVAFQWIAPNWHKVAKNEFTYNGNNHKIRKEYFSFNNANQTYSKVARDQYTRINAEIDTAYSQLWNQGTASYDTTVKSGYKYQGGLLLRSYGFNKNANNLWQPNPYNGIRNYYYDVVPNNIHETNLLKTEIVLFHNPVEHQLTIMKECSGAKYAISTVEGRYVQSGLVDSKNQVAVGTLAEGVYVIYIEDGNTISHASFIKL
ncbi:MAG: hypothetical protein IPK62_00795 [Bacteroidetes bacterium]|nr:hypothetical protein [Bacteroidota bacterium]